MLCNDAALRRSERRPTGPDWAAVGDPTEAALLAAAGKLGLDQDDLAARLPAHRRNAVRQRPQTDEHRAHHCPDGRVRVVCKGAPEAVLQAAVLTTDAATIARAVGAGRGTRPPRVPGAGRRAGRPRHPARPAANWSTGCGCSAWSRSPTRPAASAAATIAACQAAGITPVLITGDHPATARAIAAELGIIAADGAVVDCRDLPAVDDPRLRTARVFARATPEQKLDIIQARRDAGDVVAMTGDGVNDGPALRRADIGVAMGRRGTEVARQAADLVLADDELATVVAAAEEGRRVYANIRRFLLYGLSGGTAEIAGHARRARCSACRCRCCRRRSCGSTCSPTGCPAWPWAANPSTPTS